MFSHVFLARPSWGRFWIGSCSRTKTKAGFGGRRFAKKNLGLTCFYKDMAGPSRSMFCLFEPLKKTKPKKVHLFLGRNLKD